MRCYPFRAWSFCYLLYGKYDVSPMQVLLRRYTNLISIIIIIIFYFIYYYYYYYYYYYVTRFYEVTHTLRSTRDQARRHIGG